MAGNEYVVVQGQVQQFKDKPVIAEREVSGGTVRDFTIKTSPGQKLVRITLFGEFDSVDIAKGDFVSADGRYSVNESNGNTYYNLTASSLVVVPAVKKAAREVVNQNSTGGSEDFGF